MLPLVQVLALGRVLVLMLVLVLVPVPVQVPVPVLVLVAAFVAALGQLVFFILQANRSR